MFTAIINAFTSVLNGIAQANFSVLNTALNALFWSFASTYFLYLIIKSYKSDDFNLREYSGYLMSMCVVAGFLASTNGIYTDYVIPIVSNLGDNISSIVAGGQVTSTHIVDQIIDQSTLKITDAWEVLGKESWGDFFMGFIPTAIASVFLIGSAFVYAVLVCIYILITKIMITILLSLGGVFVMFYLFPSTRGMFQSWISSCINFILLNVIFSIMFSIISKVVYQITSFMFGTVSVDRTNGVDAINSIVQHATIPTVSLLAIASVYLIGIYMVKFSVTLASQLSSGVGLSHDLGGGMSNVKTKGLSTVSGTTSAINRGASATTGWVGDVVKNRIMPSIGKP